MSELEVLAYKVLTAEQMETLLQDEVFLGAPIDLADGYIHLSTSQQVTETVNKHFAGQTDLHIAAVDLAALGDALVWEPSRGGQLFPHIYAALPLGAVKAHMPLARTSDGAVVLP